MSLIRLFLNISFVRYYTQRVYMPAICIAALRNVALDIIPKYITR